MLVFPPAVAGEDQDAFDPGVGRGFHVLVAVPHQVGAGQVQVQVPGGAENQVGLGLAAGAVLAGAVGAGVEAVQMGAVPGQLRFRRRCTSSTRAGGK